jgi:hypothetical protein
MNHAAVSRALEEGEADKLLIAELTGSYQRLPIKSVTEWFE